MMTMGAFEYALMFAIPGFIGLIVLEFVYSKWRGHRSWDNQADAISSISSGVTYLALSSLGFGVIIISYQSVFTWLQPGPALITGPLLYLVVFIWKDFVGYWMHRWAHANSFLWAMHLIHHSSEEFNLPVALRQNAFSWLGYTGLMLMPLTLIGVPVEVVAVILPIQFFMQFWYHTRHIGKLGWLEYVIVTPSQHRVHHAQNPIYIDKNFGQIFCWDRLFGSFQEELDKEPPVYGITTPVQHWNPVQIELRYMARLLRDALFTRRIKDKFSVFFSRTGWRPEDVSTRWPLPKMDYRDPSQKFHTGLTGIQIIWNWLQLALTIALVAYTLANLAALGSEAKTALLLLVVASVYSNTQQLMQQPSLVAELCRLGIVSWLGLTQLEVYGYWLSAEIGLGIIAATVVTSTLISIRGLRQSQQDKSAQGQLA